jgi:hypothetical protein
MNIIALVYVSMTELAAVYTDITYDWIDKNKTEFEGILYSLGMETGLPYEIQENIQHRNRFGKVVQCSRWVGNERTDKEWINSGYASREAVDKSKNCSLIKDMYRARGLVE